MPPLLCRSSRPAPPPIEYNHQDIVDNLTENNKRRVWVSRMIEGEELYLVHVQGIAGIGLPTTLVVKKFQNMNPALLVDDNVKNRCRSEMTLLASNCHENIIKILDVIERDEAIMLVCRYPVNGSLYYWLHEREGGGRLLTWPKRLAIAIDVAKGLYHLHHGCNNLIVHHNISSSNILLGQNFKAVIASFADAQMNKAGLGRPLPIMDLPPGNFGYAAPEYSTAPTMDLPPGADSEYGIKASQLTEKADTYSFGVVLLELITGRVANGLGVDGQLAIWAQDNCNELMANHLKMFSTVVDKGIPNRARYMKEMATVFRLGVECTVRDQQKRPSMQMALKRLRRSRCGCAPFHDLLACYLP